jgi:protein-tyrosine kinase
MSRIFEALQRSESERPGADLLTPVESVAELLQAAEERRSPQVETFAAAPLLRPAPAADSRLICLTDQRSLGAEKFRVLGLRLRHLREKRRLRRIVVTGTAPEEGKSLIAANLALNQARSKVLKTVLVDGDFRRPTLASRFGVGRLLPGFTECLRGERQLSEVVYKLDRSGLWFLPSGQSPEDPLELMQSGRLGEFLDQLGTFFDWIIIDTPPILPMADTTLWMKMADGVLLVIREGVSERKLVERAVEMLDRSALLGVVVNSCSSRDHKYYYSRYSPDAVKASEVPSPQPRADS